MVSHPTSISTHSCRSSAKVKSIHILCQHYIVIAVNMLVVSAYHSNSFIFHEHVTLSHWHVARDFNTARLNMLFFFFPSLSRPNLFTLCRPVCKTGVERREGCSAIRSQTASIRYTCVAICAGKQENAGSK